MKKILFTLFGSVLISLSVLQAQQQKDTRKRQNQQYDQSRQQPDRTQQDRDQAWQQESDKNQNRDAYANEGMMIINKDEIPASLKETLKDERYAGWENATIYHNMNTGEYVIAPRAYRFDRSGKELEMENATGYRDNLNRQGRYTGDQNAYPNRTRESEEGTQEQAKDQREQTPPSESRNQDENNVQPDNDASQSRQQPSRSYRNGQNDQSDANPQNQPGQTPQNQYRTEDMVEVQAEQIPASLRRTLSERQYQGWEENGKLYQDPSTNEYVLVMDQTDNASPSRSYKFDKNGQLKEDQNESSQNKR